MIVRRRIFPVGDCLLVPGSRYLLPALRLTPQNPELDPSLYAVISDALSGHPTFARLYIT
jgi:hypothetical protein